MKLTPFIASAILAYTSRAVPIKGSEVKVANSTDLGPIPVSVTTDGLLKPDHLFKPSPLTGGPCEDLTLGQCSTDHQESLGSIPSIMDQESKDGATPRRLNSRATMWKTVEIDHYQEGVKIDIKESIYELRDKLEFLNEGGRLTVDQAQGQINNLANLIQARTRINFIIDPSMFDEMLSALWKHIISEIEARPQTVHSDQPLEEMLQEVENEILANLHAHYILQGLHEKILFLARARKLNDRLGNLSVAQARQMIKITPNMSPIDSEYWEAQVKTMENAMRTMKKKKFVEFPASAMAKNINPIKSAFKLPGEDDSSIAIPLQPGFKNVTSNGTTPSELGDSGDDNSSVSSNIARRISFLQGPYFNSTQLATNSTAEVVPTTAMDTEAMDTEARDRAVSLIGHFQNNLRYLELTNALWKEQLDLVKKTSGELSNIEGIPADLVVSVGDYFRDISRHIASSNKDLHETISSIENRSIPFFKAAVFKNSFYDIIPWGTPSKRDIVRDSPEVVTITPTPTERTGDVDDDLFWIDFGAPECMPYILDEDLDQTKLDMFDSCQDKYEPEEPEVGPTDPPELEDVESEDGETEDEEIEDEEIEHGEIEGRDIEKHMYEIEEGGHEWERKILVKRDLGAGSS